jgi:hypothetical protein
MAERAVHAGNGGVKKLALLWIRWPTGVNVVPKHVNDYYSAQFGTVLRFLCGFCAMLYADHLGVRALA